MRGGKSTPGNGVRGGDMGTGSSSQCTGNGSCGFCGEGFLVGTTADSGRCRVGGVVVRDPPAETDTSCYSLDDDRQVSVLVKRRKGAGTHEKQDDTENPHPTRSVCIPILSLLKPVTKNNMSLSSVEALEEIETYLSL